jgi:hypothetical protein
VVCLVVTIVLLATSDPSEWDTFEMSAAIICAIKVIPDVFLSTLPLCLNEPKNRKWLKAFHITNIAEATVEILILTVAFHVTRSTTEGFKTRVMFVSYGLVIFYVAGDITEAITSLVVSKYEDSKKFLTGLSAFITLFVLVGMYCFYLICADFYLEECQGSNKKVLLAEMELELVCVSVLILARTLTSFGAVC